MYSIYDQINNRRVLVYPERTTVDAKTTDSVLLTNEQIASTYFPEDIDVKPEIYFDKVEIGEGNFIYNGDNIQVLRTLPDNSIDSCVTDGPYGLKFMGKKNNWDADVPSVELWKEVYRVLKPGGYLLSFGAARTYHRMATRVEEAGFEIRDQLMWVYGSGFPHSYDISKSVDKIQGNTRKILGTKVEFSLDGSKRNPINHRVTGEAAKELQHEYGYKTGWDTLVTEGQSEWEGWGTNLKPAHEPIVMARKPFKGSVTKNILKWSTGGLNIDDCRVGEELITTNGYGTNGFVASENYKPSTHIGRFPANIIFDEEAGLLLDEQSGQSKSSPTKGHIRKGNVTGDNRTRISAGLYGDGNWIEGSNFSDKGGASRFFYCPKPSTKEREEGLTIESSIIKGRDEGQDNRNVPQKLRSTKRKNTHSTVKPVKLIQYLIRLVTPIGGITIDPFFGSGTSGKSALREDNDYKFIGIEKEKEYFDIAVERCQYEYNKSLKQAA
jgi:DNA modification methylase